MVIHGYTLFYNEIPLRETDTVMVFRAAVFFPCGTIDPFISPLIRCPWKEVQLVQTTKTQVSNSHCILSFTYFDIC